MNKIACRVINIENIESLHIVTFAFQSLQLKMMSLDLTNIHINSNVNLLVKPTHICIAKSFQGETSFENLFKAKLVDIECGKLLCNIKLKVNNILLESIITLESFKTMQLQMNDEVTVFIKANDISILEVLDV